MIKQGDKVEVAKDRGFWYTVSSVKAGQAQLCFGHSENYAGSYPVSALKVKGK